jgi:hypothetical protein
MAQMAAAGRHADGGKVTEKKKGKERLRPTPSMLGTGAAGRAGETLRSRREEQMRELGLRDGGVPSRETRRLPPRAPMPPPERGEKPRRVKTRPRPRPLARGGYAPLSYKDGGKVVKSVTNC